MDGIERDPFDMELEMLREFFDCWEAFHKHASNKLEPRRYLEQAAQRLTDAANSYRAFKNG